MILALDTNIQTYLLYLLMCGIKLSKKINKTNKSNRLMNELKTNQ